MLAADIQAVLDGMLALDGPPAHEVPIEQARAAHETETAALSGPGVEVDSVIEDGIEGPGGPIPVRRYRPSGAVGTIAYFHGGGWAIGSIESFDTVCRALAVGAGAQVVSVGYRLAPEHPFPAGLEDCCAVTRALVGEGGQVAVAGDSAGGNLAAVVARRLREDLVAQALIYPVTDSTLAFPSYREFAEGFGLTAAGMQRFWRVYLQGRDGSDPDVSPLRASDLAGVPRALVVTASHDVLRDEGEAYAAALRDAGVPVDAWRRDGCIHGFWRWLARCGESRAVVGDVAAWLRAALANGTR